MLLQSRRVVTAAEMATYFEVTERTIYRDLDALAEGGVPILGEPGVGYSLMRGYRLPPVMFSAEEAAALVTGGMLVEQMTDQSVRGPMRTALVKLTAILPAELQHRTHRLRDVISIQSQKPADSPVSLSRVQAATADRQLLRLRYDDDAHPNASARDVEPLGLVYILQEWHLIAWCRSQNEVCDFRVSRITHCVTLPELLPKRADFDLLAYLNLPCGDGETYGVVIEVQPALAQTVRQLGGMKVCMPSMEIGWECFQFRTPSLEYFAHWIISLGDRVIVRAPAELTHLVLQASELTFRHHQKNQLAQNHS